MPATGRALFGLLSLAALSGSLIALASPGNVAGAGKAPKLLEPAQALAVVQAQPASTRNALAGFDPLLHRLEGEKLIADLPHGGRAELTLDPGLQAHLERVLRDNAVPYGALVALEPATGRVLAYVSHSSAGSAAGDLARDPSPPSASVFKLVTASALIDAGVGPEQSICYGGGLRRLGLADLDDNAARDRACATLEQAIAGSINAVMAKLADRNLDRATLERYAQAFGFGRALPFDAPTQAGAAEVPSERLELARTAAGFWHMHMSPLHGALIAATFANGGAMPRAAIVERALDAQGRVVYSRELGTPHTVIAASTAEAVSKMMLGTVRSGTARVAFHDRRGRPLLPGIAIAGKTGSLASEAPYRAYSWWVGYAPLQEPEIALAALIVNTPTWRIKGSQLASEALQYYLVKRKALVTRGGTRRPAPTK
ncbi:MAG: penicillin-binding transpeptidase domain-containing protein [Polyangiales bacterium]